MDVIYGFFGPKKGSTSFPLAEAYQDWYLSQPVEEGKEPQFLTMLSRLLELSNIYGEHFQNAVKNILSFADMPRQNIEIKPAEVVGLLLKVSQLPEEQQLFFFKRLRDESGWGEEIYLSIKGALENHNAYPILFKLTGNTTFIQLLKDNPILFSWVYYFTPPSWTFSSSEDSFYHDLGDNIYTMNQIQLGEAVVLKTQVDNIALNHAPAENINSFMRQDNAFLKARSMAWGWVHISTNMFGNNGAKVFEILKKKNVLEGEGDSNILDFSSYHYYAQRDITNAFSDDDPNVLAQFQRLEFDFRKDLFEGRLSVKQMLQRLEHNKAVDDYDFELGVYHKKWSEPREKELEELERELLSVEYEQWMLKYGTAGKVAQIESPELQKINLQIGELNKNIDEDRQELDDPNWLQYVTDADTFSGENAPLAGYQIITGNTNNVNFSESTNAVSQPIQELPEVDKNRITVEISEFVIGNPGLSLEDLKQKLLDEYGDGSLPEFNFVNTIVQDPTFNDFVNQVKQGQSTPNTVTPQSFTPRSVSDNTSFTITLPINLGDLVNNKGALTQILNDLNLPPSKEATIISLINKAAQEKMQFQNLKELEYYLINEIAKLPDAAMNSILPRAVSAPSSNFTRRGFLKLAALSVPTLLYLQEAMGLDIADDKINLVGSPHNNANNGTNQDLQELMHQVDHRDYDLLVQQVEIEKIKTNIREYYEKGLNELLEKHKNVLEPQKKALAYIRSLIKNNAIETIGIEMPPEDVEAQLKVLEHYRIYYKQEWSNRGVENVDALLDLFMLNIFGPVLFLKSKGELDNVTIQGVDSKELNEKAHDLFGVYLDADNTAASNLTKEDQKVFIEEMNKKILEGSLVPSTPEEINRFVSLLKGSQDIWPTKELISFKIPSGDSFGGTLRDWLTKNDYLQYVSPMEICLKVDLDDVRKSLEKEFPDIAKQAIFLLQKTRVNKGQELVDGAIKARTEFLNTTITERNNHMAQEILKLKGRVLIYVGDAHVPGLKELLTGQGRNVENKRFPVNNAMLILLNHGSKLGGIDLTPANMNFQVKNGSPIKTFGNEAGIKFHLNPAMLAQLRNATGFAPVNITLQPLTNLRGFLGMKQSNSN